MLASSLLTRRAAFLTVIPLVLFFTLYHNRDHIPIPTDFPSIHTSSHPSSQSSFSGSIPWISHPKSDGPSPSALQYWEQAFSLDPPPQYAFPALREACRRTPRAEDAAYMKCEGITAGLTTIMSQLKVCFKMAVEAGTHLILPTMPLRDSTDLTQFNFFNSTAYMTYDKWFDAEHLISSLGKACPEMKIIHPDKLDDEVAVKNKWPMNIHDAPGFQPFLSYFWSGRPFKAFWDKEFSTLEATFSPDAEDNNSTGITMIPIMSQFLLYRITDDPTGQDRLLWNDLNHLIRFNAGPRQIVNALLQSINRPFYGVHFRAENDTLWSKPEDQLAFELDALDQAWAKYGSPTTPKPLVYLACGDQAQVQKFVDAGGERGWEVESKYSLSANIGDGETFSQIVDLPFDFQGAVDFGVMVRASFYMGIIGSAFSSSVGNVRDVSGRYRGSSFSVWDDEGARTHLFNDGDAGQYACCL